MSLLPDIEDKLRSLAKETFERFALPYLAFCTDAKKSGVTDTMVEHMTIQLMVNLALNIGREGDAVDIERARTLLQRAAESIDVAQPVVHEASEGKAH